MAEQIRSDFCRYCSTVPNEHGVGGNMYTHSIPNYERVLQEGFLSYIPRIEKIDDRDMREGLLHLVEGIGCHVSRCVDHLAMAGADDELVSALKKVPMHPAQTIYEAVVAWNFVLYLDGCDNLGCVASGLAPYHRGEDITGLLGALFDNLDKNEGWSIRLPIIPGFNDRADHFLKVKGSVKDLAFCQGIEIMPYHKLGEYKYQPLGREYHCGHVDGPSKEQIKAWEMLLK